MSYKTKNFMPARTSPGQTRSALPFLGLDGSDKLAMGPKSNLNRVGVCLRIGSVNVGTMKGRDGEVVDMAARRRLDFCCLQETGWKGEGARSFGGYKFFWMGCEKGIHGVGMLVADRWVEKVLEVRRMSERLFVLRVIVGSSVLNLISVYAPQVGRPMEEKEEFLALLGKVVSDIDDDESLLICGDFNGHVGTEIEGFEGVHGGCGFGKRNVEGEMILEFADALNFAVANTWFKKEEKRLITYESGGCRTVVDYILVRKCERKMIRDVKVIHSEPCIPQHKLLICVMELKERLKKHKVKFVKRCKVWKLKEAEAECIFKERVQARAALMLDGLGDVEMVWNDLKGCLMEEAIAVCGETKGIKRHKETWWWNEEVAALVKEKRRLFNLLKLPVKCKCQNECKCKAGGLTHLGKHGVDLATRREDYNQAKRTAKKAIFNAKNAVRQTFCEDLDREDRKGNVLRVAKQLVRKNRDVVGANCVKDDEGKVVVEEVKLLEVWRAHYDRLSNEEFPWDPNGLTHVNPVCGPSEKISTLEVSNAIHKMKRSKAAGPSGVVADMLKAAGAVGAVWMTDICNAVVKDGRTPVDWNKSCMVNVYKGKGDALACGSYRGIKLLEHAMKVLERVIERRVRNIVKIDDMQFGFMTGKGTTDAIFIVRQLQEKYLAKNKDLWMAFVDLEKAFDRVPRKVVWWALRSLGVDEWLVSVIRSMYDDAATVVRVNGKESDAFSVRVGVHQGSVLSPLLFIIVLEALSMELRVGLPMELLYADDLVLLAETEESLLVKLRNWKIGMETKGLRVNAGKTKIMRCRVGKGQSEKSGKWPCSVCRKGVGSNSIRCVDCKGWVHKRCSGILGSLTGVVDFHCKSCVAGSPVQVEMLGEVEIEPGVKVESVTKFCYLGDTLGAGGGVEEAARARVRSAWAKFKELSPILTTRGASYHVKGKVYRACVQSVLVYGTETWSMKVENLRSLERAERMMVRWMCGVSLKDQVRSVDLYSLLNVPCVADVVRHGRLRWFGHLERKNMYDWVSACRNVEVVGLKGRGRGRKTWWECVKHDMDLLGLKRESALNRDLWRNGIWGKRPTLA